MTGLQDLMVSNNQFDMHIRGTGLQDFSGLKQQFEACTGYYDWTSESHGLETPV